MITEEDQLTIYLAGGMENSKNLGAGWRSKLTPKLEAMGIKVLNPVEFEQEQLKGLKIKMLPEKFRSVEGKLIRPKHWHQLKMAPRDSHLYRRFQRYMQNIIRYDMHVVQECTDFVVCYWNENTGKGAGTHSELTTAFMNDIPVYVVLEKGVQLPGWSHGCATKIYDNFEDLMVKLNKIVSAKVDDLEEVKTDAS